jgi:hypothetical protein
VVEEEELSMTDTLFSTSLVPAITNSTAFGSPLVVGLKVGTYIRNGWTFMMQLVTDTTNHTTTTTTTTTIGEYL